MHIVLPLLEALRKRLCLPHNSLGAVVDNLSGFTNRFCNILKALMELADSWLEFVLLSFQEGGSDFLTTAIILLDDVINNVLF